MSYREKSAWIALLTYAAVFGGYFFFLWEAWSLDEAFGRGLVIPLLVGAVIALVLAAIVLNVALALFSPKEANAPADERETMIDLKAERIASYTLSVGVVCLVGALLVGVNGMAVAVFLLASLVISELVKSAAQIAYFRRGA
ncbi:MAG: hypothetical protein ABL871_03485 [Terricaulis sp.]